MAAWQGQDAKARFSELLDATIKKGPQVVTRRGVETAVLVPIQEWNRLQRAARPSLKALLWSLTTRFENVNPNGKGVPQRKRRDWGGPGPGGKQMYYLVSKNAAPPPRPLLEFMTCRT